MIDKVVLVVDYASDIWIVCIDFYFISLFLEFVSGSCKRQP